MRIEEELEEGGIQDGEEGGVLIGEEPEEGEVSMEESMGGRNKGWTLGGF